MAKVPTEYATAAVKVYLAECILKAAAQGHTNYNVLVAAAANQNSDRYILVRADHWMVASSFKMYPTLSSRWPRWALILVVVALATAAIIAVSSVREPVLRAAGWALVVNDPVAPADIIVVSLNSGGAGALEAADLVQRGISPRVAVFKDPPSGEDYEFIRRGLPYEDAGARRFAS